MTEMISIRNDRDPYIYPKAEEYIAFGAIIFTTATSARNAMTDEANAEAADPSYKGDRTGYEKGQTMRVRPYDRDAFQS